MIFTAYKKNCEVCGKEFMTTPSENKRTCSYKCNGEVRRKERMKFCCKICQKEILSLKSRNRVYCSQDCKIKGLAALRRKRFEDKRIFGRWRNHKELKNYLLDKCKGCQECGWDEEINVLEIHHKDRNRKNNSQDNVFLLCPNCHSIEHFKKVDGQFKNNLGKKDATYKIRKISSEAISEPIWQGSR